MGYCYRVIASPWLMRAAIGAALVGTMALSHSFSAAAPKEEHLEQVGAYSKLENAATMVETLRIEGREAFIRQKSVDGRTVFVVLVEPRLIKKEAKPKAAAKPQPKSETKKEAAKPAQKPTEPKMDTVVVTDTMPPASAPAAKPAQENKEALASAEPAPLQERKVPAAPASDNKVPAVSASAPQIKTPSSPPSAVVLPVTKADATESIEVMSDVYVYDRPFDSGKPVGMYADTGGAYIKEYLGWYALRLPSGKNGFIKKEDAEIIKVAVPSEFPAQSPAESQSAPPAPAN